MTSSTGAIRVVVYTGGPTLERQVLEFLDRLERDRQIELAGVFCESRETGLAGVARDLWRRRGLLAAPLFAQVLCRSLFFQIASPLRAQRFRALLRELQPRLHYVKDMHASSVMEGLRALEPTLGLVYGGPIVRPELFEIPKRGTLGIHHGKVPEYRGKKTTFWAVHNGEAEVGVTIQRIGKRLDGGDVVMQGVIPVARRPLPLLKRALERLGLDLYLRAIHAVRDGSATYERQSAASGKLYRDPSARDIMRYWARYLARLCRS